MRVALTGGIASGKSTVARIFAALGVPVIDMDELARQVVEPGSALLAQVVARFGAGVRRSDGSLDRPALRQIVFHDARARHDLEALLHPAILARAAQISAAAAGPYQIIIVPLLAETGAARQYDRVLVVDCDESLQRARLAQRDGSTPELVAAALAAQATRAQRLALADDVILNDGEPAALDSKVRELHHRYLQLAARSASAPSA